MSQAPAYDGQTVQTALVSAAKELNLAKVDQPGLDARLLLAHVLGVGQAELITAGHDKLSEKDDAAFRLALERRKMGEPVSRIIGIREFFGREFAISPAVLDPRADTEILIETALEWARQRVPPQSPEADGMTPSGLKILDLGVGTGAIILTLLAELPDASGIGVDISAEALEVAAQNAASFGITSRVGWICSDWDAALEGRFDLIVSNPPYIVAGEIAGLAIDVRQYDPHLALDGGVDGLDAYRALGRIARARLNNGGSLMVEIGEGQASSVIDIFVQAGLDCKAVKTDLTGRDRVIVARKR